MAKKNNLNTKEQKNGYRFHSLSSDLFNRPITRFRCRKCRTELFYDRHLMYHSRNLRRHSAYSYKENWNYTNKTLVKLTLESDEDDDTFENKQNNFNKLISESISKQKNANEQCQVEYLLTPMKWMDLEEYQGKASFFF